MVIASTACCLLVPATPWLPPLVSSVLLVVWGAVVIGDSPMYSALLADAAPPEALGTALTAQMALGYVLAVVPVLALPLLADGVGWAWAFAALAPGPLLSAVALSVLRRRDLAAG